MPINKLRKKLYDNVHPSGYSHLPRRIINAIIGKGNYNPNSSLGQFRDDLWATYLQIAENERHEIKDKVKVSPASYEPSQAKKNIDYVKLDNLPQEIIDKLVKVGQEIKLGNNKTSGVIHPLGVHQVGHGKDEKGEYVSYYDLWDLSPLGGGSDQSLGIGKPFEVYDRVYLDDYYKVPASGAYYLPEVTVTYKEDEWVPLKQKQIFVE